jgi:Zn-dependent protease with chaperone function
MCIVDPAERRISANPGILGDVFASHPPMSLRISRLRGMAYDG